MRTRNWLATAAASVVMFTAGMDANAVDRKITWAGCGISKNAFMSEMAEAYKKKTGVTVELKGGGATAGIRKVHTNQVTVGGTCRHILDDINTMTPIAEERRVQLTPVAWDALAVIVHKDNPIENITLAQLRDLYLGKVHNWSQFGGKEAPIELYVRKGKISGVGRTLRELVFNNYDVDFVAKHVVDSSGPLEREIQKNPNGIGVTGISSARKLKGAKVIKLDGKDPSYEHIKNGEYHLYRPLYMVTNLKETDPEARKFLEFVMGSEGKAIMRKVGTVPYEDAISLWLKYLDQQNRALTHMYGQTGVQVVKNRLGVK